MARDSAPLSRTRDYPAPMVKSNLRGRPTPTNTTMESQTPPKLLHLPHVKGVRERIETMCRPLGGKTVMKSTSTLRGSLMRVKQARPDRKMKGVVYEVPCKDCPYVYIGETERTLEKQLSKHKTAAKKHDPKKRMALQYTLWQTNTSRLGSCHGQRRRTTSRLTACWSPGTSSTTSPYSTGRGVLCQNSAALLT